MKTNIITIGLICYSILLFGQDQERNSLFVADSSWTQEIFKFPLHFAKELNYKGIEDARFPKDWGTEDSPNFWTYTFAWRIDLNEELTANEMEAHLQLYFDGLMKVVNKDKDLVLPHTKALFEKKEPYKGITRYVGNVTIYDAFRTKKALTLNVLVDYHYCEQKKTSILVFKLSPKTFNNFSWAILERIKLRANSCDL